MMGISLCTWMVQISHKTMLQDWDGPDFPQDDAQDLGGE
jgi:hypothetical protein